MRSSLLQVMFWLWVSTAYATVPEQLHYNGYLTGSPSCVGHSLEGYYKTIFSDGTSLQSDTYSRAYVLNYDTIFEEEIPLLEGMRNTIVRLEFYGHSSNGNCPAYGQFIVSGFETPP